MSGGLDYHFDWIRFVQTPHAANCKRVTALWTVIAKQGDVVLGHVRWDTGWRRYVFAPALNTIFEQDCLRDIASFIQRRTEDHKVRRRMQKEAK